MDAGSGRLPGFTEMLASAELRPMELLFLTPRFPWPPHKGDSLRVFHQLRMLGRKHRITLLSLIDQDLAPEHFERVATLCSHVELVSLSPSRQWMNVAAGLLKRVPLQVQYHRSTELEARLDALSRRGRFDAIHVSLLRMLPYVEPVGHTRIVVDLIDSLALNLTSRRGQVTGLSRWAYDLECRRVRAYEQEIVSRFPTLVVSSHTDKRLLGGENVHVIPNGVELPPDGAHRADDRVPSRLVFTGNMAYQPNEQAVVWFTREVWPLVREHHPAAQFQIVGRSPTDRVRALARPGSGIEVTGSVTDVLPYLRSAAIAVCPMRSGSGIQNKVLEAMAAATPVVATSLANRAVHGKDGRELLIGDTTESFTAAVLRLLCNPKLRQRIAVAGRSWVDRHFRWEAHADQLAALYAGAKPTPTEVEPRTAFQG